MPSSESRIKWVVFRKKPTMTVRSLFSSHPDTFEEDRPTRKAEGKRQKAKWGLVMKRFSLSAVIALVVLVFGSVASAQTAAPKPPPTYEQVIVNTWKNLHNKILTMAKDTQFPDDKLGWGPHPDSRSVREEFRHVTLGVEMTTAIAKGEKFDVAAREKLDAPKPKTRANMVAEMEAAIAASYPVVEGGKPLPQLIGWLDHQGEHYGKLVTAYRVNGIVPPVSRPKS